MGTAAVAVQLLMGLLDRATAIGALISKAQSEKREITHAELDQFIAQDDDARTKQVAAIAKARAEGR